MTEPIKPDHEAYMTVIKLQEAQRMISMAIRNIVEVGPIGAACYVRNAQIELVKAAEEITGIALRRPNFQQRLEEEKEKNRNG